MTHNIVSGRITNRVHDARNTPNWLKAIYAVLGALVVIVALSLAWAPSASPSYNIPECEVEDGSTQVVCVFHGNTGDYINYSYGEYYVKVTK